MAPNVVELGRATTSLFQSWQGFLLSSFLFLVFVLNLKPIWWRMKERKKFSGAIDQFPGPRKLPFLGNAHYFIQILNSETEFLGWGSALKKKYGPVIRLWVFDKPMIFIASGDLAYTLFKSGVIDDKSDEIKKIAEYIGAIGPTTHDPDVHAKHKKFWNPFFSRRQIENSIPYMHTEGLKLVKKLEQFSGKDSPGQVFELLHHAIRCTFNAISCSAIGVDFVNTIPNNVAKQYLWDLHNVSVNATKRAINPLLIRDWVYNNTPAGRTTKRSAERGASFMREAIEFQREMRKNMDRTDKQKCFLDTLLDLNEQGLLSENQMIGELNVFVGAGYDTTGITVCLVIYFLALYPEHQRKVVQELQQVLDPDFSSNCSYPLTWDTVKTFKYLELCIKETLRIYPILPAIPRVSTQDVKLEDGKMIPRGVDIHMLTYLIQRDPKYFPDPDAFIPERHSEGHNIAFMPFSVGNRKCIGQVHGMVTIKTIVAHLLMAYEWETPIPRDEFKTLFQFVQIPVSVKCKIRKRQL